MSGGSKPPPVPKNQMDQYQGPATASGYNSLRNYSAMPNYPQQTYNQFNPGFSQYAAPTSYNPQDTVNAGNQVSQQSSNMYSMIPQLEQMGFDPQQALYNRTAQQTQQQTRAGLEARGVNSTPYGAGVEGQTMANFNIDWQNNELQRALIAAQGAAGTLGAANQGVGLGQSMAQGTPSWQQQIEHGQSQAGAANYMFPQSTIDDWLSWVTQGNQQQNQTYQQQLDRRKIIDAQNEAMWKGLGSLGGSVFSAVRGR